MIDEWYRIPVFPYQQPIILVEFCKMEIRPIFFKEILFFDFLEESTYVLARPVVKIWEEKIEEQDFFFPKQA